jgi:hypothetical protein
MRVMCCSVTCFSVNENCKAPKLDLRREDLFAPAGSLLASGILPPRCRAFNPQGLSVIELDQKRVAMLRATTTSDTGSPLAPRTLHESDGPEFGLRHLSFGFTFWRHAVTQPSS